MSDEPNNKNIDAPEWSMPEPVFRSSEGRSPRNEPFEDLQADIPTEPGFTDPQEDIPTEPGFRDSGDERLDASTDLPPSTQRSRKTRSGCATAVFSVFGVLGLVLVVLIAIVVYLGYFYRPTDTSF